MTKNNEVPKMPSMKHLPWSQEDARRQKWMSEQDVKTAFENKECVVLEKLDGANACMTSDKVYARSHSAEPHRNEWDYIKKSHRRQYMHDIPDRFAVFGEYLYARHSIKYTDLPAYFVVFGVYNRRTQRWYGWEDTKLFAEELGLPHAPEIKKQFVWSEEDTVYDEMPEGKSHYGDTREGYVVRAVQGFHIDDLQSNMAKCVRENHVQTEELHWRKGGSTETNDLV